MQSCGAQYQGIHLQIKQLPHWRLKEYWRREGRQILRTRDQELCCEIMSPSDLRSCTCKVSPPWPPKHELHKEDTSRHVEGNEEKSMRPLPYTRNLQATEESQEWGAVLPREEHTNWPPSAQWPAWKTDVHLNCMDSKVIFRYMYMYAYTNTYLYAITIH